MGCFSLGFWEYICILIVVIIGLWSLAQLLLPYALQFLPSLVVQIVRIVVGIIVSIIIIKLIFDLLACLLGSGGGFSLPHYH